MINARTEYVLQENTVANGVRNHASNANLQTTTIILLASFAIISILFNIFLLITILLSRKLRSVQLFILFCNFAVLNIFGTLFGMLIPLLFIIHNNWLFDITLCRLNATVEQFINMELLMSLMIMTIERSVASYFPNQLIFKNWQTLAYIVVLWIIGICLAIPVLTHSIPVKPNEFRYNCDIDSKVPILYPIVCILIYGSCLIIILICFAALLSRNNQFRNQSLPIKSSENSVFVRQTLDHDYQNFSKLILLLIILFILFDGPYIILNFFIQIRNSYEILKDNYILRIPQDANVILNWLRLIYPLIASSLIYATCTEIWLNLRQCIFCHISETIPIKRLSNEKGPSEAVASDNV